jgi:hypothetical protein
MAVPLIAVLLWGEWEHWRASRRGTGTRPGDRGISEAELTATYARASCGYTGVLITETESRTTWENIQNVIPLIADADRIKIVSNSLHAERARAHLREQRPGSRRTACACGGLPVRGGDPYQGDHVGSTPQEPPEGGPTSGPFDRRVGSSRRGVRSAEVEKRYW